MTSSTYTDKFWYIILYETKKLGTGCSFSECLILTPGFSYGLHKLEEIPQKNCSPESDKLVKGGQTLLYRMLSDRLALAPGPH